MAIEIRAVRIMSALAAGAALWQVPALAAAQTAAAVDDSGIAEIIVTAQRRSESLENVPISITAATADMLTARGVNSMRDMIAAAPSVTLVTVAGYLQPRIRGIGNAAVGPGFEGGVAVYVDGVYQAAPQANLFSLANIERVEILKGPQGTLFGRNTTGGLIQVITRQPSHDFGGTASVTAANYQDFTGDIYLTGGLSDTVAMNFAGHAEVQGKGWGDNIVTGEDAYRTYHDVAFRSSLLFEPSDATRIRVTADYLDNRNNISPSTVLAPGTGFPFPGLILPTRTWDTASDVQPNSRVKSGGVTAQITQDLGFASLVSISAYRKARYHLVFDGDVSNLKLVSIDIGQSDRQFSQEVQLTSNPDSRISWVLGAFYFNAAGRFDPNGVALDGFVRPSSPLGPVTGSIINDRLGTRSLAGYAQATAPITDATKLTLGIRYTRERKSLTDIESFTTFAALPAPVPGAPVADRSVRYNRPTWRVAVDHRFSPQLLVYASYNRGFKSGGFNGQFPTDAPYLPERLDAYEVGAKANLFDRHLRIDVAGFYYDYSNIQVSKFIGSQQSFYNGAAARVYGLDVDFEAKLSSRLSLSGGMTLLHDRFTRFPNAVISTQVPTGIVITTGSAKGNRLPVTADFSATLTATHRTPLSFADLLVDLSYTYNDGYFTQPDNILRQPSYNLLAAGARLDFPNGVNARLWMRNILNEKIFNTLQAGTFDSNASYQAPRTYGITLGVKF
ncbi:TonB-dependent receptor [Rhizorhabdus histidinilytica]|uniref:TonB-dependent receptor n=1 Tax=Rhizorhabdus histidinilytica TaxID=439228 RepID=UPI00322058FF